MKDTFSKKLLSWYKTDGRHDLPWQKNQTHYRVWISEIMLQQTQVTTVIPYYERFMKSFPTLFDLANAPEDEVLAHWSGLGYYARARNIHKTAKIVVENYAGQFPQSVAEIQTLPGIGLSTAGAIVSFAQQIKAVILDGNVKRVLSRYFAISDPKLDLWPLADSLTPIKDAHLYNQAIMDLGATRCTRTKPRCIECPVKKNCKALAENAVANYPVKIPKKARPTKYIHLLIIKKNKSEILFIKRPSKGIWGGLWSFPEQLTLSNTFESLRFTTQKKLPTLTHQFTHFTLVITPVVCKTQTKKMEDHHFWYKMGDKLPGGIAAPVQKILEML